MSLIARAWIVAASGGVVHEKDEMAIIKARGEMGTPALGCSLFATGFKSPCKSQSFNYTILNQQLISVVHQCQQYFQSAP